MDTATAPRKPGKRERLIEGARQVFYQQGVERTTLADIAERTDVPVGNIYYYFKTKDDLVEAVVGALSADRDTLFAGLERRRTPQARLKGFLEELDAGRATVADYGCPIGTLSSELSKRSGVDPSLGSHELLDPLLDWAEGQFRQMGRSDARDLAVNLIASYEGATILTHALRDPALIHRQSQRLRHWIDSLDTTAR